VAVREKQKRKRVFWKKEAKTFVAMAVAGTFFKGHGRV
jgi:hypothetical protein